MNYKNYYEFQEYYSIPYSEKKYDKALSILHRAKEYLPKEEYEKKLFELIIDEARIYSETIDNDACFKVIKKSLEQGYAFPLDWERFDFLRSYAEYKDLNDLNNELIGKVRESSTFKYEVHLPKSYNSLKKYPLFFCLHGDGIGGNINDNSYYWKAEPLLEKGYVVVYPQSSQAYFHNSFGWLIDPVISRKEIKNCYDQLLIDYSIDESNIIIGGFSGGATASIDIAFENTIPVKGVIALCPGDYLDKISLEDAKKLSNRKTKIVILEGEQDTDPIVQHLLRLFKESKICHEYYINEKISHWYPKDLDEKTLKALEFIK